MSADVLGLRGPNGASVLALVFGLGTTLRVVVRRGEDRLRTDRRQSEDRPKYRRRCRVGETGTAAMSRAASRKSFPLVAARTPDCVESFTVRDELTTHLPTPNRLVTRCFLEVFSMNQATSVPLLRFDALRFRQSATRNQALSVGGIA
jgi:hypothetical protein